MKIVRKMSAFPVLFAVLTLYSEVSLGFPDLMRRSESCTKTIDLAFVIDSSRSIHTDDYKRQIEFIYDIVNYLDIGPDATRVAAVSFSNQLFPEFNFGKSSTKDDVLTAIGNIKHSRGDATRTYLALEHTYKDIYAPGNGERPDVVDVVVVLTDGETNPGSYDKHWQASGKKQTQIEATMIKSRPAYVFAIGVGGKVDVNELNGISSDPDDFFTIQVKSFKELNTDYIKQLLLTRACIPKSTTVPPPTTTTPFQRDTKNCTEAVADIFFVLDESSSIHTQEAFNKELHFVNEVVDFLEIGPTKSQVGVMTFSDNAKIRFNLNTYQSREQIAWAVKGIEWNGGDTYLDKALSLMRQKGLSSTHGSRDGVPQIGVIITDGVSTDRTKTKNELRNLHSQNYLLFAIGVGPDRNRAELELIAKNPDNVFEVDSIDGLQKIKRSLATRLCTESARVSAEISKKP